MTDSPASGPAVPRGGRPSLRALREEIAARHRAENEEAGRETRRDLVVSSLQAMGWAAAGIALIAWALHTTSEAYGRMAFYAGIAIGNGGWIFTMLGAYRRGERRGDW